MDDATISWWLVQEIWSVAEGCMSWASGWGNALTEAEQDRYVVFADIFDLVPGLGDLLLGEPGSWAGRLDRQ